MIRRRVLGGALAVFLAAWLLIAVVLVSGHDPALASKRISVASGGTTTAPVTTSSSGSTGSTGSTGTTGASSSQSSATTSSATTSSVTTRQS